MKYGDVSKEDAIHIGDNTAVCGIL